MKISIQTLLLFIALFSLALSGPIARHQTRMQVESLANSAHGQIVWNHQGIFGTLPPKFSVARNEFVKRILGERFGHHLAGLNLELTESNTNDWNRLLQKHPALRGLERLQLRFQTGANQFKPAVLSRLDDVQLLLISKADLNPDWLNSIADIEDLEILWLTDCKFNKETALEDLTLLAPLQHLAWLDIPSKALDLEQLVRLRQALPGVYISLN